MHKSFINKHNVLIAQLRSFSTHTHTHTHTNALFLRNHNFRQHKHSNRATDWLILHKTFKISNGTCLLMTGDTSCNSMKPISLISTLEPDSNRCAFYQSTQHHLVVSSKACKVSWLAGAFSPVNPYDYIRAKNKFQSIS